jgi:hypothetical protein
MAGMPWPRLGARSKIGQQVESIAHTVCMKRDRRVMHFPSGGMENRIMASRLSCQIERIQAKPMSGLTWPGLITRRSGAPPIIDWHLARYSTVTVILYVLPLTPSMVPVPGVGFLPSRQSSSRAWTLLYTSSLRAVRSEVGPPNKSGRG